MRRWKAATAANRERSRPGCRPRQLRPGAAAAAGGKKDDEEKKKNTKKKMKVGLAGSPEPGAAQLQQLPADLVWSHFLLLDLLTDLF